uniref:Transposase n=1 Tax=Magnetospirillum gryphiswaldense TaxID=55518 RepID=A4U204_9PROT|nr:transposase [Magnetospirillum gryphiswaldense MSR-1]
MDGEILRDDQWDRLREFVPGGRKGKRGPRSDARRILDAILWLARSGARWRDLPEDRFGPYQTVKRRYYRWIEQGVFDRIFAAVSSDPEMGWNPNDANVIRAQGQTGGAPQKRGGQEAPASPKFTRPAFGTQKSTFENPMPLGGCRGPLSKLGNGAQQKTTWASGNKKLN